MRMLFMLGTLALAGSLAARPAAAGALDTIHARHQLTCGALTVPDDYSKDWTHGNLRALAIDYCQALAVAALGPQGKAKLIGYPLRRQGLVALRAGKIQVLIGETPNPADAALYHVAYGPTLFEDGQGFLVPKALGIHAIEDFSGKQICYIAGTPADQNLIAAFEPRHIAYLPFPFEEVGEMEAALVTGHCAAITADRSALAVMRSGFHARIRDFAVLDQTITAEPVAPVYAKGDRPWAALVDGTVNTLAEAERLGVTEEGYAATATSTDPAIKQLRRAPGAAAIAKVGNRGEIFARDLGDRSPLGLERQASLAP